MFEITLNDSKLFRGIFEAISAIVSESRIQISKKGIVLNSIDDGRICLIGLHLDKDDFDAYKCDEDYDIGLNIDDMVKILKRSNPTESITLSFDPNVKRIKIIMKKVDSKKKREFSLQLIELGDSGVKPEALEKIKYSSEICLPLAYIDEAIKDADIFAETLNLKIEEEGIKFNATGQIGESETFIEKGDPGVTKLEVSEMGEGTFALQYMKNILKIGVIAESVNLFINSNTPIKCIFKILSSSSFTYYLAPRIEEEEEDYDEAH
jgi:proliferating cell nuclear antigen